MNRTNRSLHDHRQPLHATAAILRCAAGALALALAGAGGCTFDLDQFKPKAPADPGDPSGTLAGGLSGGAGDSGPGWGGAGGGGGAATGAGAAGSGGPAIDVCTACGSPAATGAIESDDIEEASGVVASAIHPGVFYVHNDAGGDPEIFAVGAQGEDLGAFEVEGADAVDWEDIGRGPCPAGSCLYLADIGDNDLKRSTYTIYRVPEPGAVGSDGEVEADAFSFVYPDGSHNAETLLVHPDTGAITIVTKVASGASSLYELDLPPSPGGALVASKAGEIAPPDGSPRFTGGDVHPSAEGVLLRTYSHALFYPALPGQRVAEALSGAPCAVPVAAEEQGEAIAWTRDGAGYVTVSEGAHADLHAVHCAP
jgi:hypothetical protein